MSDEKKSVPATLADKAREYVRQSRSENTRRGYRADFRHFSEWCRDHGVEVMPATPVTLAAYLTDLADTRKVSTLQRRISAISQAHQTAGHDSPTKHPAVKAVWAGIRRTKGTAYEGKAPLLTTNIRDMIEALPDSLIGVRDRALLLIGYAGGLRRSEIVALDVGDIEVTDDGLVVTLRRSKTDQEGQGRKIGIPPGQHPPTCPVRALKAWLEISGITEGALFRGITRHSHMSDARLGDRGVSIVVKRAVKRIGLDPDRFGAHSLRAGFVTQAAAGGATEHSIMLQTGHTSTKVLRGYIRNGTLFDRNAAAMLGL